MIAGELAMAELVCVVGGDAARTLAERFGGTSVYVPKRIGDHHPLCVAIGRQAVDQLAEWTGGAALAIPKQVERRARVVTLRKRSGLTIAQIARETSYSERHVYRLLAEEAEAHQPSLFD